MKKEALELADFIEKHMVEFGLILGEVSRDHIVGTIRKLVAELDKQGEPVAWIQTWEGLEGAFKQTVNLERIGENDIPLYTAPQTKPLSEEELYDVFDKWTDTNTSWLKFGRLIEERHGIK